MDYLFKTNYFFLSLQTATDFKKTIDVVDGTTVHQHEQSV